MKYIIGVTDETAETSCNARPYQSHKVEGYESHKEETVLARKDEVYEFRKEETALARKVLIAATIATIGVGTVSCAADINFHGKGSINFSADSGYDTDVGNSPGGFSSPSCTHGGGSSGYDTDVGNSPGGFSSPSCTHGGGSSGYDTDVGNSPGGFSSPSCTHGDCANWSPSIPNEYLSHEIMIQSDITVEDILEILDSRKKVETALGEYSNISGEYSNISVDEMLKVLEIIKDEKN